MRLSRVLCAATLAATVLCAAAAQAQKLTPLHIAVSTNTVTWFPLYVGWKKGIFKEQGFESVDGIELRKFVSRWLGPAIVYPRLAQAMEALQPPTPGPTRRRRSAAS